jgi:hypothetical protein
MRISKFLSLTIEPISKSTIYELAKAVSSRVVLASKPMYRRSIAGI